MHESSQKTEFSLSQNVEPSVLYYWAGYKTA